MSQWRRIAIEEMPCCQRLIEKAKSPNLMWIRLYDNLFDLADDDKRQVFNFALSCLRTHKPKFLASSVWAFFDYVVGGHLVGPERKREFIPRFMTENEFYQCVEVSDLSAEEAVEIKKQYTIVKYGHKSL